MEAIVRKQQQRKLLEVDKRELEFTVRGSRVKPQKIDRWMKRNSVTKNSLYAPSPATSTPSAVDCRTISERGSPVPSPAYSPAALNASPGGAMSAAQSPAMVSPALSVASIVWPRNSNFAGQSPAPTYQPLPNSIISSVPTQSVLRGQVDIATGPLQRRYKQTDEEGLQEALSQAETWFGIGHPETFSILFKLGDVLIVQGRYKSAEKLIRRLVEGHRTVNGNNDNNTLDALELLGRVLECQGLYAKAEKLLQHTFKARKMVLGEEHPGTLTSMANLASTYRNQGRWKEAEELEEAEELFVQVMETRKRVLGEEHPDTLTSMANLAHTWKLQSRNEEAILLMKKCFKLRKRVIGPHHPNTNASLKALNRWQRKHLESGI
ncbi:uncharacterized protein BDR25DRAFT_291611 [Lindgomyces ingoldianus]|uniref:Uncharacterized protein n=1 Tax=Lindgomyces ingoldianus TaxID=673940 RepID=A0ACB6QNH2_9PLEO|nr:uncharacterized protein BDR25DRAFT_291611 [Lindgomyces ingoldianus]KAF2467662.1 hypothetical protein BDR25DRAFT_291611 [Lindgomyces ingoldianus]